MSIIKYFKKKKYPSHDLPFDEWEIEHNKVFKHNMRAIDLVFSLKLLGVVSIVIFSIVVLSHNLLY